jgi:hypothetical protein
MSQTVSAWHWHLSPAFLAFLAFVISHLAIQAEH